MAKMNSRNKRTHVISKRFHSNAQQQFHSDTQQIMALTSRSKHEIQLLKNAKVARDQQAIYEKETAGIAKEKARINCLKSLVALISMIIAVIVFLVYLFIYGFHFSGEKCPSTLPIPAPLVSPPSPEWIMFQLADNVYHVSLA